MKNHFFLLLLILELITALTVRAQIQPVDSLIIPESERFHARQLIIPGTLLGVGAFGAFSPWYMEKVNIPVRDYAQELSRGQRLRFDDYIQYIPSATFLGLGLALPSEHDFIERLCITATSYAAMGILVNTAKYTIREPRPDSPEARNAFPSGHTATAFMGAELVRREYGGWWGAGAYAIATTTAVMRIYNGRHWTSDVLGGAAIGILSADIGYWMLPLERRLFRLDSRKSRQSGSSVSRLDGRSSPAAIAILPTPYGLSFSCVF